MTGMALAHCILGKYLGVVCHCFPPPLDVPTFAARCLCVCNYARDPSSKRWKCGRESCPEILPKFQLPHKFRALLYAANLRHGTDGFTSPPKEGVLRIFFRPKNPTASAGLEPANLGTKGQHATPIPPKPLSIRKRKKKDVSNRKYKENSDVPFMVFIYWTCGNEFTRTDHSCVA